MTYTILLGTAFAALTAFVLTRMSMSMSTKLRTARIECREWRRWCARAVHHRDPFNDLQDVAAAECAHDAADPNWLLEIHQR